MSSILERLGIFDIFSIFIPGIIIKIAIDIVFPDILASFQSFDSLIVAYFIGLLFHEVIGWLSELLKKQFMRDGDISSNGNRVFDNKYDKQMVHNIRAYIIRDKKQCSHEAKSKKEKLKDKKQQETEQLDEDRSQNRYIISVATNDLEVSGHSGKAERLQTSSEQSCALGCAFALLFIIKTSTTIHPGIVCKEILICVGLLVLSALFFARAARMRRYHLRCLIRTYAVAHDLIFVSSTKEESNHDTP